MKIFNFFAVLFLIVSTAGASTVENYTYPYNDPYLASLTYEIMQTQKVGAVKVYQIPGMASRDHVPFFEGRNQTQVNVYKQKVEAPLAFLVTGTGSNSSDPGVNGQAEMLFDLGYHVIVLPSPLSWHFILAENPSGIPGYTPDDSRDLFRYMQKVMGIINADQSMKISGYVLAGYSLGAGEAAFIYEMDREQHVYNFQKVLLVNPPLELLYSVNVLDGLLAVAANWSADRVAHVQGLVYGEGQDLLKRKYVYPDYFINLDKTQFGNTDNAKFLIGAAFRQTLGDDIFVNQQIKDTGVLKTPATKKTRTAREAEAHSISYNNFAMTIVVPYIAKEHSMLAKIDTIFDTASVNGLLNELAADPNVYIFHNADDFLDKPEAIAKFQREFGDRMTVFPHGGHLGNLWFPENEKRFQELFKR